MQEVQLALAARPVPVKYVPAKQSWQVPAVVAPRVVEYRPAVQEVQLALAARPVPVKYVPAKQSWQVPMAVAPRTVE